MKRSHEDYLKDVLDAIASIGGFTSGMDFEDFLKGQEAAKAISEDFKKEHPEVPWKEMARMRDKLIHAYFGVDLRVVWKTLKEDVPFLKGVLSGI
ncbi:DUF86 domain-containing protein [Thermococcus sp.]|uniref:HepT-like ribonuclease domain-containing protein n=1 Tax=Thermococcus sp. TaxID=35749 RepID=UPI0025E5B085|nr:DUF86 domain-containing protein [Thermococcus sp.]